MAFKIIIDYDQLNTPPAHISSEVPEGLKMTAASMGVKIDGPYTDKQIIKCLSTVLAHHVGKSAARDTDDPAGYFEFLSGQATAEYVTALRAARRNLVGEPPAAIMSKEDTHILEIPVGVDQKDRN